MTWWGWLLAFVLLFAVGTFYLFIQVRGTWRRAKELTREVHRASDLVAALTEQSERLSGQVSAPQTRIFDNPEDVRVERDEIRERLRAERLARRAANLPPWARR